MAASAITDQLNDLVPRRYQEEVFLKAQAGNVIAAMSTGSGKTLISLLLIRWMTAQPTSNGKAIIFLVPKVPLVEQQSSFIAQHTPLRVLKLHGAMDIDLTDRLGWQRKFEQNDVFVMTAQIFLNMLTHSIWSIDRVSLLIFDECHHARRNHPYNGIMREYSQVFPTSSRPKVFGMTASPIYNPKDALGSLKTLETNMDAKIVSVLEHVEELSKHSPKPVEIIKEYPYSPQHYDFPSPLLFDCLSVFGTTFWTDLEIPWSNIETRYHATLSNLGPYAASLFIYTEMEQHIVRAFQDHKDAVRRSSHDMEIDLPPGPISKSLPPEFWAVSEVLFGFQAFFRDPDFATETLPAPVPLTWCSPKLRILIDILIEHHTSSFQGIVFVEQRQIAIALAKILPTIPELSGLIRSGSLIGQGVGIDGPKITNGTQRDSVEAFRSGKINLLIATSVAEEGLDFPACDLVIRFDPLFHMVGYVQSRGRARNKASTFVIMVQENDISTLSRYQALKNIEPDVKQAYQSRHMSLASRNKTKVQEDGFEDDDDAEESLSPLDVAKRERYVVPSSGAILSYDNAISLLNYLCSLIPRDPFTPQPLPEFSGDFQAIVRLPGSLPLAADDLVFTGPIRASKKEAKRAAAFRAVWRLFHLDVFDRYLLPTIGPKHKLNEDSDGRPICDVGQIPPVMAVTVIDPWTIRPTLWIHSVFIGEKRVAGLVSGTFFPPAEVLCGSTLVRTGAGRQLMFFDEDDELHKRELMCEYTKLGIWYRITSRFLSGPPSLYFVPITHSNRPDFGAIRALVDEPYGNPNWHHINEEDCGKGELLLLNNNEWGRPLLLRNIRHDLTPSSIPLSGSREEGHATYYDFFMNRWTRRKRIAHVPEAGPLIGVTILPRSFDGTYSLYPDSSKVAPPTLTAHDGYLVPMGCCKVVALPPDMRRAFEVLPAVCHRLTDIFRARRARLELGLPPIDDNRLVEALTLPSCCAGYNNQRLETLGDAVLKLCTSVHLFNKFPFRHEGQLSALRQSVVTNRFLLSRAKEIGLERFLTSETQSVQSWRYSEPAERGWEVVPERRAQRHFPRRSLQDCMEAILGASFVTGGIQMALQTGIALGLCLGGPTPWSVRFGRRPRSLHSSRLFLQLEERLGYTFHRSELLVEAMTHPSFSGPACGPSYQRLEFLGDALLDLVVVKYLFDKFPAANSHQLAWPKTRAVCAQTLAYLAITRLELHNIMLVNRVDLTEVIDRYVPVLQAASTEEIVKRGWKYDPPKPLSDVFESLIGAILIDSAYNYEKAAAVVQTVMGDVLSLLTPSLAKDPVSELVTWAASKGCTKITFEKQQRMRQGISMDGMSVLVHGNVLVGPVVATSLNVAKIMAAERSLIILRDVNSERSLSTLCFCGQAMDEDTSRRRDCGDHHNHPDGGCGGRCPRLCTGCKNVDTVTPAMVS